MTKEIAFTPFTQWKDQESPKPLTKEQLKQVALDLGIPEEMAEQVQADQGEAYYWGTGERWITPVQFYQNGKIVAGASVDSFTLKQYLPGRPKKAQTAPMKASKRFMTSTERLMRQLQKLHSQVLLTF